MHGGRRKNISFLLVRTRFETELAYTNRFLLVKRTVFGSRRQDIFHVHPKSVSHLVSGGEYDAEEDVHCN